jgi:hypothetical protein
MAFLDIKKSLNALFGPHLATTFIQHTTVVLLLEAKWDTGRMYLGYDILRNC